MNIMRVKTCVLGPVRTNCYLVYHDLTKAAVVIDPADNGDYILSQCKELNLSIKAVLLTHGHFDHIMAAEDISRACSCSIYASEKETELLENAEKNLSITMGEQQISLRADITVKDGNILQLAGFEWQVIETPGHTAGSVCYYVKGEDVLFAGDTLFEESFGRTDLPTGSSRSLVESIETKLFDLPDDTFVYPGHGSPTNIGYEKKYNPVASYYNRRQE